MRIKNYMTDVSPERVKLALEFASRGVRDTGVEVLVMDVDRYNGLTNWTYYSESQRPSPTTLYTIRIRRLQEWTWYRTDRIKKLYPSQIKMKKADAIVFVAAFYFRKIQYHRRHNMNCTRYDAEKWAWGKLCDWRVATGRNQIVPLKQSDPFKAWRDHQAAEFQAQIDEMRAVNGRRMILVEDDEE